MSLQQVWEFQCNGCGVRRVVADTRYSGKPYGWTGPNREDGEHVCERCQDNEVKAVHYSRCPHGCGARFIRIDVHFCGSRAPLGEQPPTPAGGSTEDDK